MNSSDQASVLVVEEDAVLRHLVAECLEAKGFAVGQAVNATEALARLQDLAYDGLVVDLGCRTPTVSMCSKFASPAIPRFAAWSSPASAASKRP